MVKIEQEILVDKLRVKMVEDLPGLASQLVAAPPFRASSFSEEDIKVARRASVLWLMYPCEDGWEGVLIVRASYDGVHSGQVALPGGEKDKCDKNDLDAALRECEEEIGVRVERNKVVGALSPLYIPPSKFYVRPYVACLDFKPEFVLDEVEVSKVLFLKISKLCSEDLWREYKIKSKIVPGFEIEGNIVWGATAMILAEISDCCRDIFVDTFAS